MYNKITDENGNPINASNPFPTQLLGRKQQTIQTHNAVSVNPSSFSVSPTWIDCFGYDEIGITVMNNAATSHKANILWSNDGVTQHGRTNDAVPTNTDQDSSGLVRVRARYFKLSIFNGDTAAHTMSAWVYLKA